MVDWSMGVRQPQISNDYVDKLFDSQAQKAAGRKIVSGDYRGAAGDLASRGDVKGAQALTNQAVNTDAGAQYAGGDIKGAAGTLARGGDLQGADTLTQHAQADADRQAATFQKQHDYLQRAVPVLTGILQKAGPAALAQAFDQIAPELESIGTPKDQIDKLRQSFATNPEQTLQVLGATAAKKFTYQKVGEDLFVFDEQGNKVQEFKGSAAPPAGYENGPAGPGGSRSLTPITGGPADPKVLHDRALDNRTTIVNNPTPQRNEGAFRNLTPAEVKERGYKPGTRAQVNDNTGQVNVLQSPNESDLKTAGYANRAIKANTRLDSLAAQGITKPTAQILISERNGLTRVVASNQKDRQFIQASKEWLAPILRKDTGAAVTDSEFVYYSDIYIPRPEDGADVLAQKKEARAVAMESLKGESGPAYSDMFGSTSGAPPAAAAAPKIRVFNPSTGKLEGG